MAKSPSFCRPCNKNCKCSADPETKIINMCTECLISEGYYRDENDWTCKKCSSVDGLSNCKTCSWDKVLKVPIC